MVIFGHGEDSTQLADWILQRYQRRGRVPLQQCLRLRCDLRQRCWIRGVETGGMAEATRADADRARRGRPRNVIDDVVRAVGVAAHAVDALEVIEAEVIAHAPRDHMIGAGGVAADAEPADDLIRAADLDVGTEASTEDVHATDTLAD